MLRGPWYRGVTYSSDVVCYYGSERTLIGSVCYRF
jgi:hypothetical protein